MNERLVLLLGTLDIKPVRLSPVAGGDINDNFRVYTDRDQDLFVKMNRVNRSKSVIMAEAKGLEMMRSVGVDNIPGEILIAESEADACLVMPYYGKTNPSTGAEWIVFFENLARMHLVTHEVFGGSDNFIGYLPQINSPRNNWVTFFIENRLGPQIGDALDAGYLGPRDEKSWDNLREKLPQLMPIERPALIHGDLWSGNILPTDRGILMIDPCPYFGHREMDFAMMELFSGVPVRDYLDSYNDVYKLEKRLVDRIEIYQLYYLLVHLNMFGTAYLPSVRRIMEKFS